MGGLTAQLCDLYRVFFGIHSSVFSPITSPIMVTFIAENIAAMNAGEAIPHFYTAGAVSSFFGFTGCGISIGCVVACMLSKSKRYRKIGKISLFPALFGINEPILFGAPIILNPIMFIPMYSVVPSLARCRCSSCTGAGSPNRFSIHHMSAFSLKGS